MSPRFLILNAILLISIASQLFWFRQVRQWGQRLIPSERWRGWLGGVAVIVFLLLFAYNLAWSELTPEPTHLTLKAALLEAPFRWWMLCSLVGFLMVIVFWVADRLGRGAWWVWRKAISVEPALSADPPSPGRRRFLEQTAIAVSTAPFFAGAYGLFYGRLNLEVTRQRVRLPRLPKAFDGFRIAQLSDIHIGPFMPTKEVRRYVAITNRAKPDLVVLTGDFVTWDPTTQQAVVHALAGLKAPFGVFGCLGNHEMWTDTEDSITRLFAAENIRMLRLARAPIQLQGETLNLMGVDFQTSSRLGPSEERRVRRYLEGVERLVMPDTANILLSHNPNTFDRAAQLGIDLSLAGHTHGGQVTLEFISPNVSPSRLVTPYVRGWFEKPGGRLYVNSGIGTIGVPVRVGAPPEIALFELVRSEPRPAQDHLI